MKGKIIALTKRQQQILDYIIEFGQKHGMAPTINEISDHFEITSPSAFAHVRALQRKGYVTRSSKARSLLVNHEKPARHFSLSLSIPLLGRINAGAPVAAEEHIEKYISLDPSLLPKGIAGTKLFALKVQGDSMQDLGIMDGDIVMAKQEHQVKIGDIVVAMVDGETTVKSLYLNNGEWELRPANKDYKSIFVPMEDLQVQGVVVALHRVF